jgi:cellulose synthase/poly-beta-1,6-N-acetylglucosamine synthase-like glycosyltransferase
VKGAKMVNQKNNAIRIDAISRKPMRNPEIDRDTKIIKDSGRAMRFFLNLSFALIIAFPVFVLMDSQWLTNFTVIAYLIPVITTIIFFIAFVRLLKCMEKYATQERNIKLVSRIIWEFNRSSLIRLAIGKTKTFIDEEGR